MKDYDSIEDEFKEAWNSPYFIISNKVIVESWKKFPVHLKLRKKRSCAKTGLAAALMILLLLPISFLKFINLLLPYLIFYR